MHCYRRIKWWFEDHLFLLKMFFYDYMIDPIKDWYSDHFEWNKEWVYGYYTTDEEDKSGNFWIGWSDEDTYVTKKDSYYNLFKDFKNGTSFRCHWIWNSSKNKPQKIKDIQIIKKKNYGNRKKQETF